MPKPRLSGTGSGIEDEIVVNLKNTGSTKCSLQCFLGVQLVNLDDLAITVSPSSGTVPDVIVDPVGYHVGSGK